MANASPKVRIAGECARRGRREVVAGCLSILGGAEADPALLAVLGGPPTHSVVRDSSRADADMWARIWAARGLLWALDEATVGQAAPAVVAALNDPAWRVREKAAQVVARHRVDEALEDLVSLRDTDPIARVRAAADRATRRLTVTGSTA